MEKRILVRVRYQIRPEKRAEFSQKIAEAGIAEASRQESGNLKYDYMYPDDSENEVYLTEIWSDLEALDAHGRTAHYREL